LCHKTRLAPFLLLVSIFIFSTSGVANAAKSILRPSLTIGEVYDDNINFSDVTADSRGDDFITRIIPGLTLTIDGRRFRQKLSYSFESRLYAKNPKLNFFTHRASVDTHFAVTPKTTFNLTDAFILSQEATDLFSAGIQTRRTSVVLNTASVGVTHDFSEKFASDISYSNGMTLFTNKEFADARTDTATTGISYKATAHTTLSGSYVFASYTTDNPHTDNTTVSTHTASLGLDTTLTPTVELAMSGGGIITDVEGSRFNWSAEASLLKTFNNATVKLGYARTISNSFGLADDIIVSQIYSIVTTYNIGSSNLLTLAGYLYDGKSVGGDTVNFMSYQAFVSDEYQPFSWLKILLGYTYIKQDEQRDVALADSFVRNLIYVNFSFTPGGWKL